MVVEREMWAAIVEVIKHQLVPGVVGTQTKPLDVASNWAPT